MPDSRGWKATRHADAVGASSVLAEWWTGLEPRPGIQPPGGSEGIAGPGLQAHPSAFLLDRGPQQTLEQGPAHASLPRFLDRVHRLDLGMPILEGCQSTDTDQLPLVPGGEESNTFVGKAGGIENSDILGKRPLPRVVEMGLQQPNHVGLHWVTLFDGEIGHGATG